MLVTEDTAEISHEAIVLSWPRYVAWLRNDVAAHDLRADDKRVLDALVDDASRWAGAPEAQPKKDLLAHGHDLQRYESLARRRPAWLGARENNFVAMSAALRDAEELDGWKMRSASSRNVTERQRNS